MSRYTMALAMAFVLAGTTAQAGVVDTFLRDKNLDPTDWQNAVNNNFTHDTFADSTLEPGVSMTGPVLSFGPGYYQDTANGSGATIFTFEPDVFAVLLIVDLNPGTVGTGLRMNIVFADGSTHNIDVLNNTTSPGAFVDGFRGQVGFVADMPVDRVRMFENNQTNLGSTELYRGLDIYYSTAPEPASLALLALGGAATLTRRRR